MPISKCELDALFVDPFAELPPPATKHQLANGIPRAPRRNLPLNETEKRQAVANILRYVPEKFHSILAHEFAEELCNYGHIYAFRFCPDYPLKAPSIDQIPAECEQAAAIILMILNNLDPDVAQFPRELITYGGNGQVFANWIQFRLVLRYLASMSNKQTLVLYSGHPLGLFPSHFDAPRLVITNGMMIPNYSTKEHYDKFFGMGVTMYGQMTAGSYCYIGPQGIVHGTTITLMNAGRKYLGVSNDLAGKVFVSSGLGGMSGAQSKAASICGCVGVIAEISESALLKRHKQGWLNVYSSDLNKIIDLIREYRSSKKAISIGYLGNVVDLWERLASESENNDELLVDLGSDQTSCHCLLSGGYYPVELTLDQSNQLISNDPKAFEAYVQKSLLRQINAIERMTRRGMRFWDYGNAFLLECSRYGAQILADDAIDDKSFKFPSYFQDIMGDIFSLGFGPFRWVCCSDSDSDLELTDRIAASAIESLIEAGGIGDATRQQYLDNLKWIQSAGGNNLVVGSKARILYADQRGRVTIALALNEAIKSGQLTRPIVISRDHHDVSGTDSPFRETANINDGSAYTADMAVQNAIGDAFRGATWIALHNGGGVGWGDVINGGFGLLLDGSEDAARRAKSMLNWDVSNGVARRSWSGNQNAQETIRRSMEHNPELKVTLPNQINPKLLAELQF